MEDLISVIVPIFKVEKYISKCIEHIIKQTYKKLEIILVDDGSPDDCPEICDQYAGKDERIKVIHKENSGPSDARNVGIEAASGEYMMFVDGDDYIELNMVELLYARIIRDRSDMAICNINYVDERGHVLSFTTSEVGPCVVDQNGFWRVYYEKNSVLCVVPWNKLYRRKLFENVRYKKGKRYEDEYILYDIVSQCDKISFLNERCYFYVQRKDSFMGSEFSINRIDGAEALIERGLCFKNKGQQYFAECSLSGSARIIEKCYYLPNRKDNNVKQQVRYIHNKYRKAYLKLLPGSSSIRFWVVGGIFFMGVRPYTFAHGAYLCIKNWYHKR